MSGFTLFQNSANGVSFTPEFGFKTDDRKIENTVRTRSAIQYKFKTGDFKRWSLPIRFVNSSDKKTINDWWNDNTDLFFYDDNDTSIAATFVVRITNRASPIRSPERPYDYLWKGKIEIEEIG